jgi:RNA polymerase sigma factor (sigma-70 family)
MENPFHLTYTDQADADLVALATQGDKKALESLITRHQIFVYNLALKMTRQPEDAEDLTQEVFIKAITALGKFKGKSSFRTWMYRITVNHFLNTRKKKHEIKVQDFESYFNSIDSMPESELNAIEQKELSETVEEIRINCTAGMLMCLDQEQRLIYILGEMFEIDHVLGSDILRITPGNFRIRLMRARKDLYNWMNKRCGLINEANPCRCARKTKGYIKAGIVDPDNLTFNIRYKQRIWDLSNKDAKVISETVEDLNRKVFQSHPLQLPLTKNRIVDEVINNKLIRRLFSTRS